MHSIHAAVSSLSTLCCSDHLFTVREVAIEAACVLHTAQQPVNIKRLEMSDDNRLSVKAAPVSHTLIV